ncbi:MAG: hypothetical protein GXZ13_00260 [Synergistaceae bacterium]|nr:hypothetical protein [Synergistaceae bacterium]
MKKYMLALALVFVYASGATAYQNYGGPGLSCGPRAHFRHERHDSADISPEVRAKHEEVRKFHIELRDELTKTSPDKSKARELHQKIQKLQQEISEERFEKNLKNPAFYGRRDERFNLTKKEKAIFEKMRKAREDMSKEYDKEKPNEAKLRTLHKKLITLRAEFSDMKFEDRLENPGKYEHREGPRRHRRY